MPNHAAQVTPMNRTAPAGCGIATAAKRLHKPQYITHRNARPRFTRIMTSEFPAFLDSHRTLTPLMNAKGFTPKGKILRPRFDFSR